MRLARKLIPVAVFLSLGSTAVAAQAPADFRREFLGQFEASARKLVSLAEAMPAESFAWRPMDEVASVASVYMHISRYNLMYPEENLGFAPPAGSSDYGAWEDVITEKDEAVRILAESMDWVREVLGDMSDDQLSERTMLYGRDVAKWAVFLQLVTHMNEHLGQSIAYARMNGVVPPWSM